MKVYLAGKIHGEPNYFAIFADAAAKLRADGHEVFNPAAAIVDERSKAQIMAHLMPQLCDCQAIALLPNWGRSPGARVELSLARYIGLETIYL